MGMSIDEHIGVIEDLKSTMSVCMSEPEKTEICISLSEAIDTMRKYQKIEQLWTGFNNGEYDYAPFLRALKLIIESEEVEDGK